MYKTIKQFSAESGYTPDAIRNKISRNVWQEGIWVKAPDNIKYTKGDELFLDYDSKHLHRFKNGITV